MRMRIWIVCLLVSLGLAGCGGTRNFELKSLADFAPQAGAGFDLRVKNYDLINGGGSPQTEDALVMPFEREGINVLESLGYKYVAGGDGARYVIEAHLISLDPTNQMIGDIEDSASDWLSPAYSPWEGYAVPAFSYVQAGGASSLHPEGSYCSDRLHLVVHDLQSGKKAVLYSGSWKGQSKEVPNCPVSACAPYLESMLVNRLGQVFDKQ